MNTLKYEIITSAFDGQQVRTTLIQTFTDYEQALDALVAINQKDETIYQLRTIGAPAVSFLKKLLS